MKRILFIAILLCAIPAFAVPPSINIQRSNSEQINTPPQATVSYDRDCSAAGFAQGAHTHITTVTSGVGSVKTITIDNATSGVAATQSWSKKIDTSIANEMDITCATKTQ